MKRIQYQIAETKLFNGGIIYLNLIPQNPKDKINFRPGQYGLISFLRGSILSEERPFSFASSPIDKNTLQFGFKVFGRFTSEFAGLKKGDSVFIRGPYGSFIYNEKKHGDAVFLSAGIGITPFMSVFRYAAEKKLPNNLTLLFSNKTAGGTPFYNELKDLEKLNPAFKAVFALTDKGAKIPKDFIPGRINEEVLVNILKGKLFDKTFFICGPQQFTESMVEILKRFRIKEKNIKTEGFTLAPSSFFEKGTWTFPVLAGASLVSMIFALYTIEQMETNKNIAKTESAQIESMEEYKAYVEKINKMEELNQAINERKNNLLAEQEAGTKTVQIISRQIVSNEIAPSSPPVAVDTTPKPIAPKPTVVTPEPTPKPTPAPEPAPTPAPKPTPAPAPAPDPPRTNAS